MHQQAAGRHPHRHRAQYTGPYALAGKGCGQSKENKKKMDPVLTSERKNGSLKLYFEWKLSNTKTSVSNKHTVTWTFNLD